MALRITFTDGKTSDGYKMYMVLIGGLGTMMTGEIKDMKIYVKDTGNITHIGLISEKLNHPTKVSAEDMEVLYPKSQVLKVETI